MLSSPTALRAFADTLPGSHLPVAAVASSSDTYLIVKLPALPPAFSRAQLLAADDVLGLRAGIALERKRRVDGQRLAAAWPATAAAAVVVVAARGDAEGHSGGQAAP